MKFQVKMSIDVVWVMPFSENTRVQINVREKWAGYTDVLHNYGT